MSPIHRKTAKGIAEFETRSHGLSARMRGVLILVDGHRSDVDIVHLLGPHTEALLVELTWQSFIERVASNKSANGNLAAGSSTVPQVVSQPTRKLHPTQPSPVNFAALRQQAVARLTEQLGPLAQNLAISIERADDHQQLEPLLERASNLIENMLGAEAASRFRTQMSSPSRL